MYAAWYRETPVAVKRTSSLMEVEMNLHAGVCECVCVAYLRAACLVCGLLVCLLLSALSGALLSSCTGCPSASPHVQAHMTT